MPTRITPITLWRAEVDNQPGALARILEPLASVKADLKVVMAIAGRATPLGQRLRSIR